MFVVLTYHYVFGFLGKVYAMSLDTDVEVDDCISVTNNNLLKMSLIETSHQNICLPVKDSSKYYSNIINLHVT